MQITIKVRSEPTTLHTTLQG